jgi:TonB family protein
MCGFTSRGVAAALKAAAPKYGYDPSDSPTITIVATCGATQKEFDFPYPANVDRKALNLSNIRVSHLWDTYYRISERAFGKDFSFDRLTPELGTELLPELISGKYQTAYADSRCGDHECDNYLAWLLQGYTEAPQPHDPGLVILLDGDTLHFTKYVSPTMNPLAMMARISGDVRLRILVDPQGLVRNVEALSGHPLLQQDAIKAAQSWQFAPDALSGDSVEATLRFELRCR